MKRLLIISFVMALAVPVTGRAATQVTLPVDGFYERQQFLTFGTYVDQAYRQQRADLFPSGGYPKFFGYHAAVDIEHHDPELTADIPVRAIADGQVAFAGEITGYGGLIIIRHSQPEAITSLYGHVRLRDATVKTGDQVHAGQVIAQLGAQFSPETSGERKHLHFGIHKGTAVDYNGYEPATAALNQNWYDPNVWLKQHGAGPTAVPTVQPAASATAVPRPAGNQPHKSFFRKLWDTIAGIFR